MVKRKTEPATRPHATIREAAEYLDVSVRTLNRWAADDFGPHQIRTGRKGTFPRYAWDDLRRFKIAQTGVGV